MSLRINLKQGQTFELTNVYTHKTIKVKCVAGEPMKCNGCIFANPSSDNNDICAVINCNGNYREDNTFINFIKIE